MRNDLRQFSDLKKHSWDGRFLNSYFQRQIMLTLFPSISNKFDFPSKNYPSTLKVKTSGKRMITGKISVSALQNFVIFMNSRKNVIFFKK